jgi:hypothetical protein
VVVNVRKVVPNPVKSDLQNGHFYLTLNREVSEQGFEDTKKSIASVPKLAIPAIALNTYFRIVHFKVETPDVQRIHEIGYTSDQEEKDAFIR